MASVAYGSLPFSEQIRFLRAKRDVLTESYLDLFQEQHDTAFMVAGANRADLVADFRAAIDNVIAQGATLAEFRKEFDRIVAAHGWDYTGGRNWRSRVIYETNLRQSYNAGRYEQLQRLKRVRPYWRYRHSDAVETPRPDHLSWDGLVLPADDPWWDTHFPANGWGCQCYVEALNERDLRRLGKSGPDKAPPIEYQTVTVGKRSPGGPREVQTPVGVDPGFGYAPGKSLERATQAALQKTARLPAPAAAETAEQLLDLQSARAALDAGYAEWQAAVLAERQARNLTYAVGSIDSTTTAALQGAGIEPVTSIIVARDVEILHALRDTKQLTARALTAVQLARLPALLRAPTAVLLDVADQSLLYIAGTPGVQRGSSKVVVALNYRLKTEAGRDTVNSFRTATLVAVADLRAAVARGELRIVSGSLE